MRVNIYINPRYNLLLGLNMLLTKNCYENMAKKLYQLRYSDAPKLGEHIDECRSNGSIDDNPEYYQALEEMSRLNKKIDELSIILSSATIFSENMRQEDTVTFGTEVTFINTETGKEKTYTILSEYDSDISKGIISVNAPFTKEMLGLHTGDYFYFNDTEYVISNICYSSL